MSLDMVQACIAGYADSLIDKQVVAVQTGYWSAYFANSKHPKSVKQISESIMRKHEGAQSKTSSPRPDVDVEAFLEQEARFKAKLLNG